MSGSGYLKFRNDRGIPEIRIEVREFECIGESPPQDHQHVYINMGEAGTAPFSVRSPPGSSGVILQLGCDLR